MTYEQINDSDDDDDDGDDEKAYTAHISYLTNMQMHMQF